MKLPRFLFQPLARHYFMLWRIQRRENIKLKRELTEWQNRLLEKSNVRPLYKPEPKPIQSIPRPPIGATEKRAYLAEQAKKTGNIPTAEQVFGKTA